MDFGKVSSNRRYVKLIITDVTIGNLCSREIRESTKFNGKLSNFSCLPYKGNTKLKCAKFFKFSRIVEISNNVCAK